MRSTLNGAVPAYLGVDLTDRYSRSHRPSDVCGLQQNEGGTLTASFWLWYWDPAPESLDVTPIVTELTVARAVMFDGPQGLARPGAAQRVCERLSNCVGKTPDARPVKNLEANNFAGFICSSLDLFGALAEAGTRISPLGFIGGASEVYPGHIWQVLASFHLPNKKTDEGRIVRKRILEALGVVGLPELPTHDQNDLGVALLSFTMVDYERSSSSPQRVPRSTPSQQQALSSTRQEQNRPAKQQPSLPTPQEATWGRLSIVDLAPSVFAGEDITLIAQAQPGATCSVAYLTPSGRLSGCGRTSNESDGKQRRGVLDVEDRE
jgi:hypothetical protein